MGIDICVCARHCVALCDRLVQVKGGGGGGGGGSAWKPRASGGVERADLDKFTADLSIDHFNNTTDVMVRTAVCERMRCVRRVMLARARVEEV